MITLLVLVICVFSGCVGSSRTTSVAGVNHGGIAVSGATGKMVLFLDGVEAGLALKFDGKKSYLDVDAGTHVVTVKDELGNVVFKKTIYIDDILVTITVP